MQRLDIELVVRGIAPSREKAKQYIQNGKILVDGKAVAKPSFSVDEANDISYIGESERYVSRGGLKLERALDAFKIDLARRICVDLGASTGGFTDCMLQNGADKVYSIDVGHGQLAKKLIEDDRVINIEGVNVKEASRDLLDEPPGFASCDLSFISLKYGAQAAYRLLANGSEAVFLIKPQFEAGKSNIAKGGIVKDRKVHILVLSTITDSLCEIGFSVKGLIPSPIKGGDGNIEYLVYCEKTDTVTKEHFDYSEIVAKAFSEKYLY